MCGPWQQPICTNMADVVHACGHVQTWPGASDTQVALLAKSPCSKCTVEETARFKAYLDMPVPSRRQSDQKKGQ